MNKHLYKLTWTAGENLDIVPVAHPEGVSRQDIQAAGSGGCDAVMIASVIYPEDGSLSIQFTSKDGRTGQEMTDLEKYKVFIALAHQMARSETLSLDLRAIAAETFSALRDEILGRRGGARRDAT